MVHCAWCTCVIVTHCRTLLFCVLRCDAVCPALRRMQVTFVPDVSVFSPGITFDADTVASRLRELAFLNAGSTMKLRLLKHGEVLPMPGASRISKAAKQAAAAAEKPRRRSKQATAQQEEAAGAAAGNLVDAGSNGSAAAAAAAAAEEQGWQMFCYQAGLKEYVQW